MTEKQIQDYEYCKWHLAQLKDMKERSPFRAQMHGCGSRDAKITHELQAIHTEMYNSIHKAIDDAENAIKEMIASI